MKTLEEHHMQDLQRSGLNEETVEAAGIRSASAEEVRRKLRRREKVSPGIEFPYTPLNGGQPFSRFKLDNPPMDKNGRHSKYLSPVKAPNRLYIPATLSPDVLRDPAQELLITEGEKKALKAVQEGFHCIGLAGVWCWKSRNKKTDISEPIPDLEHIIWKGRIVYIVFDSDLAENKSVQRAESALAQELQRRGAVVRAVRLPDGSSGAKVGLDDFLVQHGDRGRAELEKLLEAAREPHAPITILDDPNFVEAALAFVGDTVMVARMVHTQRDEAEKTYQAWEPQIITSDRRIIAPPNKASKDSREIIPLADGYFLKKTLEDASARWSIKSVRHFIEGTAIRPDIATLYRDILQAFRDWCYFPDEHAYHVISLHVFGSYFFELFQAYPYVNLNGPPGSGKTTTGRLAAALGFNGRLLIDPSQASLFRMIEREKPYLVIDEKENAATRRDATDEPGLMALLKAGYQRGAQVSRQNGRNIERTEFFSVFSPKMICNVHGLEDILQDRSISLITRPAPPQSTIRGSQPDPEDSRWQELRDRLYLALMFYHQEVRDHRDADLGSEMARLREKELFKPLVDLALWIDAHGENDTVLSAITEALDSQKQARAFSRSLTPEAQLVDALRDLLNDLDEVEAHTGQIREAIAAQSTDAPNWCSEIWIGKMLRKLHIWQGKQDECRRRAMVPTETGEQKEKMLKHYVIRRDRLPEA
jgi:hypothetical protein